MAQSTYQSINLITDIVLTWPFSFTGTMVVLDINDINASQDGWTIALPDATLAENGQNFIFNNISGFTFEIVANDAITVLATVTAGQVIQMYLIDSTTSNGTWRVITPPNTNGITQLTAQSSDSTITITNGTVTPPTGTINFQLPTSLANLLGVSSTAFLVVASNSPLTFETTQLVGGTNITINDGTGLSGNVIIDLNSVISGISSLGVGSIVLTGTSIITNEDTNGNIQLSTNGTGKVQINGVSIDTEGNITGINNFVAPQAFCVFTDTLIGPDNSNNIIVIGAQSNVLSVTGAAGTYTITWLNAMPTANYGVFITLGTNGTTLPFISNAYFTIRTTTSLTIQITDASGSQVLAAPYGVSVMIVS
jgi:hypothetical protein